MVNVIDKIYETADGQNKKRENANRRASVSLKMESRVDRGRFSRSGMSPS